MIAFKTVIAARFRCNGVDELPVTSACDVVVLNCCRYNVDGADESRSDLTEAAMRQCCGGCEIKKPERLYLVAMVQTETWI